MDATLTRTHHHTHSPGAPTLSRLSSRVWTTRWTASPGASLLVGRGAELTVVDHGMSTEATERLLTDVATAAPALRLRRMVWLRWDHGSGERTPEHAERLHADQIRPAASFAPGSPRVLSHRLNIPSLPGVSAHAPSADQLLLWDRTDRILLAGDLLAPVAPELWGLTPSQAEQALRWISDCAPHQVVGSHGTLLSGADIERAITSRLTYLRVLRQQAIRAHRSGATERLALHQALTEGVLAQWAVAPERHLINLHAALAEHTGRALDMDAVATDVRRVLAERGTRLL
ncbi:hypothetical protein ABZ635_10560 [Nocardiopsis sp. NPDC007018]|uniref:hypothetical protein n=1 Tax=Nocardiopsis sp. NPDC007018 TaxID=3155721 RepID=UPI0033DD0DA3